MQERDPDKYKPAEQILYWRTKAETLEHIITLMMTDTSQEEPDEFEMALPFLDAELAEAQAACAHMNLNPKIINLPVNGKNVKVRTFQCDDCGAEFTPKEAERLRT